jgi:energy-coupling factor transporter ATP-binding protein EcfA2
MQLEGMFDVPPSQRSEREWLVDLPIEDRPWQIGLIVGASGSGKTTLAREAFKSVPFVSANVGYEWPSDKSIVDAFPPELSIKDVTASLSSVGFSSPPSWLRPFNCLSTGEQFRATVARALCDQSPLVVIDEFTSVVDRTVAQIGSAAVAKAVRRTPQKQLVAVTCHYDVVEWLCPDWVVEMPSGIFTRRLLRRPPIQLEIRRVDKAAWTIFKHHHYLDTTLHKAAKCFVGFVNGQPAAFASVIHYPHPSGSWWREHRTVCLPDFQGVGIGNALSSYVGGVMQATGKPYRSTTANPAMIKHRANSKLWKMARKPSISGKNKGQDKQFNRIVASNRFTAGFEYTGPTLIEQAKGHGII